jgi:hypothetical protein
MGRFRLGTFTGILVAGAVIAFGAANCAPATQIILDIHTDAALCKTINVGVALATPEDVDKEALSIYQEGCESGSDRVGTLTITPRAEHDAKLAVRVVAGVNGTRPDNCGLPDSKGNPSWAGCIVARRTNLQFAPGKTVSLTIVLSEDCLGQVCSDGRVCNLGKCVEPDKVQPDGGNAPVQDGEAPYEDAHTPVPDATPDAPINAPDACAQCSGLAGVNASCNGVTGSCSIDCADGKCKDQVLCGPGLDCKIDCPSDESCKNTQCATSGKCSFNCLGTGLPRCGGIRCRASTCEVKCEANENTCSGVSMDAGTNTMTCTPAASGLPSCVDVSCFGGVCSRTCGDGGCGGTSSCTGTCTNWEDGGDGG